MTSPRVSRRILLPALFLAGLGHAHPQTWSPRLAQGPRAARHGSPAPANRLTFPSGIQRFEVDENLQLDDPITRIPGWRIDGVPGALTAIVEGGSAQPGGSRRWLRVEDRGTGALAALSSPPISAPGPWNYAWSFSLRVDVPPATAAGAPVIACQHARNGSFEDAWGVRLTPAGAELFVAGSFGPPASTPLFPHSSSIGEWIRLRVDADLVRHRLVAWVDGVEVAQLQTGPVTSVDLARLRLAVRGGATTPATLLVDDVGIAFLFGVCEREVRIDFSADDDGDPLVDGQDIASPPEFGRKLALIGSGPNRGAAVFDSSNPGPNSSGPDPDLLVRRGNLLILQNDAGPPAVAGVFPRPDDDEHGGVLAFSFPRAVRPVSMLLVDMDSAVVRLTDFSGLRRTYSVPPNWTGDITQAGPGFRTLDLQTLAGQPGFGSTATVTQDPGFDPGAVVSMTVTMTGSGALDDLFVIVPCVTLSFDFEDDGNPLFIGTPIVNGQDLSTPPEFGAEIAIADAGPNTGAFVFDSSPTGSNNPGPDQDLLVGLGNILALQNDQFPRQTVPGVFDIPNDDQNGGTLFFYFPRPVECIGVDLINIDEEDVAGLVLTLLDTRGRVRVYDVPPGWTENLLNDGPPGFRSLDLTTVAPQPGFTATAVATQSSGFDPRQVIQITAQCGGAQALDNLSFSP